MFERGKFAAITHQLYIAITERRSRFWWFRRDNDCVTWRLLVMTCSEECDNALVAGICRLVNALMKLRGHRQGKAEEKCTGKTADGDCADGAYIPVQETPLHCPAI